MRVLRELLMAARMSRLLLLLMTARMSRLIVISVFNQQKSFINNGICNDDVDDANNNNDNNDNNNNNNNNNINHKNVRYLFLSREKYYNEQIMNDTFIRVVCTLVLQ